MRPLLPVLLVLAAGPLSAEDLPVLAIYGASSGSLPPEFAWNTSATIHSDGSVLLQHCRHYATEGPDCQTTGGQASPAAIETILSTARASGLLGSPAVVLYDPPVGGGQTWGTIYLPDGKIDLPSFPVPKDAPRVTAVLQAITDAIPPELIPPPPGD